MAEVDEVPPQPGTPLSAKFSDADEVITAVAPPPLLSPMSSMASSAVAPSEPAAGTEDSVPSPTPASVAGLPEDMDLGTSIPTGPPPIEIVFSFDTTGSMSQCLDTVKENLKDTIQRLFMDIPSLKIAVIAHGDYCDADVYYLYKAVDFTNDVNALCDFVQNVEGTGGGDWEECYEFILRQVRQELSWSPGTQRSLVMIGDAAPHEKDYHLPANWKPENGKTHNLPTSSKKPINIDWKEEVNLFQELGVKIYGVQCLSDKNATEFWSELSNRSHGKHLQLEQFGTIIDFMMAICYRERGPDFFEAYERQVRWREGPGIRSELDVMLGTLRDGPNVPVVGHAPSMGPVASAVADDGNDEEEEDGEPVDRTKLDKALARLKTTVNYPRAKFDRRRFEAHKEAKKAAKLRKKLAAKAAKAKPPKQNRFSTTECAFNIRLGNAVYWGSWHLAMSPTSRNTALFQRGRHIPAVYEVSVQPAKGAKRKVVYCCSSKGLPKNKSLISYLLGSKKIREALDCVIAQGCNVFVRRAEIVRPIKCCLQTVKTADELKRAITKKYEYVWNRPLRKMTEVKVKDIVYCPDMSTLTKDDTV